MKKKSQYKSDFELKNEQKKFLITFYVNQLLGKNQRIR